MVLVEMGMIVVMDNDDTQASESHPGGNLGFFAPNCHIHGIGGGEKDHKTAKKSSFLVRSL